MHCYFTYIVGILQDKSEHVSFLFFLPPNELLFHNLQQDGILWLSSKLVQRKQSPGKLKLRLVNVTCVCVRILRVTHYASNFRKIDAKKISQRVPSRFLSIFFHLSFLSDKAVHRQFHKYYQHYHVCVIVRALLSASLEIFDVWRCNYWNRADMITLMLCYSILLSMLRFAPCC